MKTNFSITLAIMTLIGLALRVYLVVTQPIWLDEQYTIFFATFFSYSELAFKFTVDIHPGWFYVLAKSLLTFVSQLEWLRLLLATLPQIAGIGILLYDVYRETASKHKTLLLAIVLLFNPFLLHLSWQLRMYGFITLTTCLSYMAYRYWYKNQTLTTAFILISSLLIGNLFSYLNIAVSGAFVLLYSIKSTSPLKIKIMTSTCFMILISLQFVLLSGLQLTSQFGNASWIPSPSFSNFPRLYLTMMGLDTNVFSFNSDHWQQVLIGYIALGIFIWIVYTYYRFWSKRNGQELFILGIFPIICLFLASLLLPFLSHRFFFHTFIPDVSLFLPRIHLPFFILSATVFIRDLPQIRIDSPKTLILMAVLVSIWGITFFQLIRKPETSIQLVEKAVDVALPEWLWQTSILSEDATTTRDLRQASIQSIQIRHTLKESSNVNTCEGIRGMRVGSTPPLTETETESFFPIQNALEKCCIQIEYKNSVTYWQC